MINRRDKDDSITKYKAVWRNSVLGQAALSTETEKHKTIEFYNNALGQQEKKKKNTFFSESSV